MSNSARPADRFADQVLPYARLLHSTALRLTGNPALEAALESAAAERTAVASARARPEEGTS